MMRNTRSKKKLEKAFILFCVTLSTQFVIVLTIFLFYTRSYSSGNHWLLFGTWIDRLVIHYRFHLALGGAFPLTLPIFFKRSLLHFIYVFLSFGLFVYAQEVLWYLGD